MLFGFEKWFARRREIRRHEKLGITGFQPCGSVLTYTSDYGRTVEVCKIKPAAVVSEEALHRLLCERMMLHRALTDEERDMILAR